MTAPELGCVPGVMPVDRDRWRRELHLSNFINTYYQFRDVERLGKASNLLVVGPGQGLDTAVFRWRGYDVTTYDIDLTFQPDHVGSVHDMGSFRTQQFDVVIASHVLEHLPEAYLDQALRELGRVARHTLVYLPIAGRHCQVRFVPGVKDIDLAVTVDIFNFFKRPDGGTPRYMAGQHYWEVGLRGFHVSDLIKRFAQFFEVLHVYRNRDWPCSQNFVLQSRNSA